MDVSEEIPQPARHNMRLRVDGEALTHSPAQAVAVTKVLGDDNLLMEIIVRVGFPTTLVRAALVCKRWLGHASDPKFLSRFRKLHPPRLLGYYLTDRWVLSPVPDAPRFVPVLPQPTELAAVICRLASYSFGTHEIVQCQNGSVFTKCFQELGWTHGVHRPLCAEKGMEIIPPLAKVHSFEKFSSVVSKEEGSGLSCFCVLPGKSMVKVYMLQDGVWRMHASATCLHGLHFGPKFLLVGNKIYIPATSGDDVVVLDLTASSLSTIQVPHGVKYHDYKSMLSRADDDSSVYLLHVEEFQLCVWLRKGGNWLLVDTICLHEMLAMLGLSDHTLEDDEDIVEIIEVGDGGQFVFLRIAQCIFYLDIKSRTPCKVYENTFDRRFGHVHPFMMMWPPIFPVLKDDPARDAM